MIESKVERTIVKYAKSKGWLVFKFVSPANKGVPDRIFIKRGYIVFIEFKKPGEDLNDLQFYIYQQLKINCCDIFVVDNISEGKKIIDSYKF